MHYFDFERFAQSYLLICTFSYKYSVHTLYGHTKASAANSLFFRQIKLLLKILIFYIFVFPLFL